MQFMTHMFSCECTSIMALGWICNGRLCMAELPRRKSMMRVARSTMSETPTRACVVMSSLIGARSCGQELLTQSGLEQGNINMMLPLARVTTVRFVGAVSHAAPVRYAVLADSVVAPLVPLFVVAIAASLCMCAHQQILSRPHGH